MALRIDEHAILIRREDGDLVLKYNGRNYTRREIVHPGRFGEETNRSEPFMASDYVAAKMLGTFGEEGTWPQEAVEFVFPLTHAAVHRKPSNDPSEQA